MDDTAARNPPVPGLPPPADVLGLDHVLVALAHPRRRHRCHTLLARDEWSLTEFAATTAEWAADDPESGVDATTRDRVFLRRAHVPLVDHGVVAFDPAAERIAPGEHAALDGLGAGTDARGEDHAREGDDGGR